MLILRLVAVKFKFALISQKICYREQKKHFVITHLLIFTTLNFANHFANSQKRIKYEKDTFRLYGFDSVAFWG